jgi:cation diffusion facilitator CzcD-associated flavoprotein CzcO
VIEAKDTFGGTWETHKYPGVRSDSDLYTFGYRFKPWIGAPIASADEILKYMGEVIDENGIGEHIRYGHRITGCHWSSTDNLWTVETARGGRAQVITPPISCGCARAPITKPYVPDWAGLSDYKGTFIHAQLWDPAIDVKGKRVLVIGSGATAATVVPAFCDAGAQVTMLQRSPTYFCHPNQNELADRLRQIGIDEPTVHRVVPGHARSGRADEALPDRTGRGVRGTEGAGACLCRTSRSSRTSPQVSRVAAAPCVLPRWRPVPARRGWPCAGGDRHDRPLYRKGVRTASGEELEADIVVACTGFRLSVMGDIPFAVDGKAVNWHDTVNYRGMMFTGVPNLVWVMGYFRASWTLRVAGRFRVQAAQPHGRARCEADRRGATARGRGWSLGRGSSATTSIPAISCADWMSCRAGATSRNGGTIRTIGPNAWKSRRSIWKARNSSMMA